MIEWKILLAKRTFLASCRRRTFMTVILKVYQKCLPFLFLPVCLPTTKYFIVVSQVFIQQKILEEFEMRIKIKNKAFDCEKLARKLARNEA